GVHVLKAILIPVVTVIGLELGSMIAFAVVTETVFAWPGMGKLLIDSIYRLDRPVIVAYLIVIVLMFVVINFVVDVIYPLLDPRVRLSGQEVWDMALADIPVTEVEAWRVRAGRSFAEFAESRVAVGALAVVALLAALALLAPWVAPQNPFDLSQLSIMDNKLPPFSRSLDGRLYLPGTHDQGRH